MVKQLEKFHWNKGNDGLAAIGNFSALQRCKNAFSQKESVSMKRKLIFILQAIWYFSFFRVSEILQKALKFVIKKEFLEEIIIS